MGAGIQEPTIEQKQTAFKIIQDEINKTEYKRLVGKIPNDNRNLMIKNNSISIAKPLNSKTERSFNWLDVIYNRIATNRIGDMGEFFHFKSFERALQIILQQSLLLFSLDSQSENDYAELSEYYYKYSRSNHYRLNDSTIKDYRENTFVFCFTKSFRNERFWREYARKDTGVAIGFSFSNFNSRNLVSFYYQLRDVFYDNGYALDFINEIRAKISRNCKVDVDLEPYKCIWFPYFYKREKYSWEDETRLAVYAGNYVRGALADLVHGSVHKTGKEYKNVFDNLHKIPKYEVCSLNSGSKYITLPFKNYYFNIKINEVVCGRKVSKAQIEMLREAAGPNVNIWQRS